MKCSKWTLVVLFILLSPFLRASTQQAKAFIADKLVFKVAGEVFALTDLKKYHTQFLNLKCYYPDSILFEVFSTKMVNKADKELFSHVKHPFSGRQTVYFYGVLSFYKLMLYTRSYSVDVKESLKKYFYHIGKKNKCDLTTYLESGDLRKEFEDLLKMEIFLRSRFLSTQKTNNIESEEFKKATKSVQELVKSIEAQVDQEIYW